jgi:UDP-2,4-diacetamido-2,4,6-trideoxy-beta-L-altropyranose hydrolase
MNCFFRVNSGPTIGSGHFIRSFNLAQKLVEHGWDCYFISDSIFPRHTAMLENIGIRHSLFTNSKVNVTEAMKELKEIAISFGEEDIDWLVVDDYKIDAKWDTPAKLVCKALMVIEDVHKEVRDCDILLDMNYRTLESSLSLQSKYTNTKLLMGPKFALLDERFENLRKTKITKGLSNDQCLLIYFGSVDDYSLTLNTYILTREKFPNLRIRIVIQQNSKDFSKIVELVGLDNENTELFINPDFLGDIMSPCTIAVGAGGISLWERLSLGIYCINVATADNQEVPLEELHKDGAIRYLGAAESFAQDRLLAEICTALTRGNIQIHPKSDVLLVCDGLGTERVVSIMASHSTF